MEELEKCITINENRILIYRISKGYAKPTYTIMEGFLKNSELVKTYELTQWDDYGLNGYINDDNEVIKISFDFDINHPLYFPLLHLLNYDNELLIDDDSTREDNKKYMLIRKENNKIFIDFINKLKSTDMLERFHVFIKNIGPDGRSKIDQNYKDTKMRLFIFFFFLYDALINDYHQISIEEYLLKKDVNDDNNKSTVKILKKKNIN